MKKQLFCKMLAVLILLAASGYLVELPGQVSISFPNNSEVDYGTPDGLAPLLFEFIINSAGQVSVTASTESPNQANIDFVASWSNAYAGTTSVEEVFGKTFSFSIDGNRRIQCRNGGGLGMQGSNQWRLDNRGTEIMHFILGGDVGINFLSFEARDIDNRGEDGNGNFVFKDFDSEEMILLVPPVGDEAGIASFDFPANTFSMRYKTDSLTIRTDTERERGGGRFYSLTFDIVKALPKPPAVVTTTPAHNDSTVEVTTDYVILFDNTMEQAATSAAVTFTPELTNRQDSWNEAGDELTIAFDNLPFFTAYTVKVGKEVLGTNGLNMVADTSFTFRTLPEPPEVIYTYPENLAVNVPVNTPFTFQFAKSMVKDSVEKALSFSPEIFGFSFVWNTDSTLAFVTADEMETATMYFGTISTVATDVYGIRLPEPFQFAFTTASAVSVESDEVSAVLIYPNPATDVLHIRGMDVVSVKFYNITGQMIKEIRNSSLLNVNDIKSGSYIVTATDRNDSTVRRLINIK